MADLEALIGQYLRQLQESEFFISINLNRPNRFTVRSIPRTPTQSNQQRYILKDGEFIGTATPISELQRRQLEKQFRHQKPPPHQFPR